MNRKIKGFLCLLCMVAALCAACSRVGNADNSSNDTNTGGGTADNDATVGDTDGTQNIFDDSGEQYLYYASVRSGQFDEKENILYNWDWCLSGSGLFYVTWRDISAENPDKISDNVPFIIGDSRLHYISYEQLFALDDAGKLYIGMTEEMPEKLNDIAQDIDLSNIQDSEISTIAAYGDGVVVFTYKRDADGKIINRSAVFLDGNLNAAVHDITEAAEHAYAVLEERGFSTSANSRYVFDVDGNPYYCQAFSLKGSDSTIYFFNENNSDVKCLSVDYQIKNIISDGQGRAYWMNPGEKKLVCFDFTADGDESDNVSEVCTFDKNTYIDGYTDSTSLWTQDGIYTYSIADRAMTPKLEYERVGIGNGLFDRVRMTGDKDIVAVKFGNNSLSLYCFHESDTLMSEEKIKLRLAVTHNSTSLEDMVRTFNKANGMYEVEIDVYDDSSTFMTQLASKSGPDIIDTGRADVSVYADKDYLEDLNVFLGSPNSRIKKDDLLSSMLDASTCNGKLVSMPVRFFPLTLIGGDYFSDYTEWTVDDYITLIENNDRLICHNVLNSIGVKGDMIEIYWCGQRDQIIDFASGEAHFDSPEFIRLLKAVNEYEPDKFINDDAESNYWKNDRIYLSLNYITGCKDLMLQEQAMCGQEITFLGFPVNKAVTEPAYAALSSESYGISVNSKNKEGAWEFIQFALRYTNESTAGYPVYIPNIQKMLANSQEKQYKRDSSYNYVTDSDGNPVEDVVYMAEQGNNPIQLAYRALTDEEVDTVWDILDNIGIIIGSTTPMEEIFWEEISGMLDGVQTPEQTAAVLQDRFSLMLMELQ